MDLGALAGVSKFNILKLQKSTASEFINLGLSKYPNYTPLLRLKENLNGIR
jgi:hypothetical protein